ncbi:hypothetical protein OSB04_022754 [Centaurea solstitialis]|uniref:Tf2-1-like SH3-like domain-containing protein n=1 Tax=Centaurea solstitialis TaxID=347529 RepID=A0AA38W1N1_9ASTR|nr:hypothetical protein OSB04_022754 [Centaurea solstitialis]
MIRFGKRGRLGPRYVGPFTVSASVEKVAYRLELAEVEMQEKYRDFSQIDFGDEILKSWVILFIFKKYKG